MAAKPIKLHRWQTQLSAIASGFFGDWLVAADNPLAVSMGFYDPFCGDPAAPWLAASAAGHLKTNLMIFVHGLAETETIWTYPDAPQRSYGEDLAPHLQSNRLYLRYNSGLNIHENGALLSKLLSEVQQGWPVPLQRIDLIGHSMGGLVIRSACHQAASNPAGWLSAVQTCVYLGSPHLGAPLARFAADASNLLGSLPRDYLKVIGEVIDLRSRGIRDLEHGAIHNPSHNPSGTDTAGEDWLREIRRPPLPHLAHYAVTGSLATKNTQWFDHWLGDAMVPPDSGKGEDHWPWTATAHFPGIDHIRLAHHPVVLAQLQTWLSP